MSRRTFLKISAQLLALLVNIRTIRVASTLAEYARIQTENYDTGMEVVSTKTTIYGAGAYGFGSYSGYQTYLPLVNKESN